MNKSKLADDVIFGVVAFFIVDTIYSTLGRWFSGFSPRRTLIRMILLTRRPVLWTARLIDRMVALDRKVSAIPFSKVVDGSSRAIRSVGGAVSLDRVLGLLILSVLFITGSALIVAIFLSL